MSITLGSNVAALRSIRQLDRTSKTLGQVYERLSSGQRINRASDDAASLAIAEKLGVDVRVFTQAVRNANDGISLTTIADGAIESMKEILLRLRELATQGSNGTYSLTQRTALDVEAKALQDEYNRTIETTKFNGKGVFDEASGDIILQLGYGVEATLGIEADVTLDFDTTPFRSSTTSAGAQATGGTGSYVSRITPDSRYVVFNSDATNLVSGDSNAAMDIFRKDLVTGEMVRVSTSSNGSESNGTSFGASVSADGRYVAFYSNATNLVSGDTNGQADIFLKDMVTGTITRMNTSTTGTEATGGGSFDAFITPDGRYVAFESLATNLVSGDTNGVKDVFLKDTQTGELIRVNTSSTGAQATGGDTNDIQLTPDGRYALFYSVASNLISGDSNALADVFVKDLVTGTVTRANTDSSGAQSSGGGSFDARFSADGRFVVFESAATNLVSGDTNALNDIFVKDILTGATTRVSTSSSETQATGGASFDPTISATGQFVVFESDATNLVSGDTNGNLDIFIKNLLTGELVRANLDQNGNQVTGTYFDAVGITPDGRHLTYISDSANLASGDTNGIADAFISLNPMAKRFSINKLFGISMQTQSGARWMQTYIDNSLNELLQFQGQIGAAQQRMHVASAVLQGARGEFQASANRIKDVDIADETSRLAATQILQQVGSSLLAQVNQSPQIALKLLQGG